ncbi:MAG: hypothetical protein ACKO0Z_01765 [Betaproteobacteria bacterium]
MKQLFFAWVVVCAVYFTWRYAPPRLKFFAWQFIKTHAFWVIAILGSLIAFLVWQSATATKLF